MQRVVGYVFFAALAAGAGVSLYGRYCGAGAVGPGAGKSDWFGFALIVAALCAGAALVIGRRRTDRRGRDTHR